jgi:GT2 family glycosyltransferase
MKNPLVSLVIVNWNGKQYLQECLKSIEKSSYKKLEIIVVDQGSKDGSQDIIRKDFPQVKLIQNKQNTGYVGGNNLGVSKSRGEYVFILNNDVILESNTIQPLINYLEKNPDVGCLQPKAINLRNKNKIDGAGSFFTSTGFLYHKGYLDDASKAEYSKIYPVYCVKGAYMLFRRSLFLKLGGLDKDFFIYFEESDFCGRIWLAGYKVMYVPLSNIYHCGGGDTREDWDRRFALVQYRSYRNRICSYMKNLSFPALFKIMPVHFAFCFLASLYYLFRFEFQMVAAIYKAMLWNLLHLREALQKRAIIQKQYRTISDKEIFRFTEQKIGLRYLLVQRKMLES